MNLLISAEYLDLQRELHSRGHYGVSGLRWADAVHQLAVKGECKSVLDYGCGQGFLAQALPLDRDYEVAEYDPAIDGKDTPPRKADLVYCGDVLEHVEMDYLDVVLNHLRLLTRKLILLVVATEPASKTLADGRNAHLIVKPAAWWLPRLTARWELERFGKSHHDFHYFGTPR